MKNVLKALHQHPIAVYPIYIDLTGSIAGGVLLSQLLYWIEKVDREIWKTDAEIIKETHLTQTEFKNAKKAIAALPFMSVAKKGTPPTTRYNVDWDKMSEFLEEMLSSVTYQLNRRLSTNKRGGNLPNKRVGNLPYNTETTSETTPKNTFLETQNEIEGNDLLVTTIDEVDETAVKVVELIPSAQEKTPTPNSAPPPSPKKSKREPKYIYPPAQDELIPLFYAKFQEKKRDHPNIVDCWNWANHQAEKFFLHWEGKGWKIEKLNGAIATWVNGSMGYGTLTKPCPIQYKGNPDTQQPTRPTQPAQQERPVLTQHDIEYSQAAANEINEMFKNMGVRI
jgi:hypothetical protein